MLKPYKMDSIVIAGQNNNLESVIKELHNLKVLHIVEHSKNELADIGSPLESSTKFSETIVLVRALIAALKIKKEDGRFELKKGLLEINSTAKKLNDDLNSNLEELKKIDELLSKNKITAQELGILKGIKVPLEDFTSYRSLEYFTGFVNDESKIANLKEELQEKEASFALFDSAVKKNIFIALFIDAKANDYANEILKKNNFVPVKFMNIGSLNGTALQNLEKTEEENARLEKKKEAIKSNIEHLKQEHKGFLLEAEKFLGEQLEKAEAPLKFASTQSSFLIKGWVPSQDSQKLISRLDKITSGKIFVHFEPARKGHDVPIKLKNPKPVSSFEMLMNLYTMPLYGEIDPTFFLFLTFPILFGFMLGDFGYGLTTLFVFMMLKKSMQKFRQFFDILILSSISSIIFGIIFGEFFGFEEIFGHELPRLLSRSQGLIPLLALSIMVGVLHIVIGLVVGFINEKQEHGFMHALYAKGSWLLLLLSAIVLIDFYISKKIIILAIGGLLFLISIIGLIAGEGIKGVIELPGIFSNILSYARLMAIGVSSVELAIVVNKQAEPFFHNGPIMIIFGVMILVVGHAINIILGLMGSFLHSLRLHYVEFFTKFFQGGAIKYEPFGMKSNSE